MQFIKNFKTYKKVEAKLQKPVVNHYEVDIFYNYFETDNQKQTTRFIDLPDDKDKKNKEDKEDK